MSIEKNIETLAENSTRIAAALEGILAAISNGVAVIDGSTPAATGTEPSGVTSGKTAEDTSEADTKAAAKTKAAAEKAAKEEAAAAAKVAAEKAKAAKTADTKPAATKVSYDSIKAIVTEMAGTPDGVTAIKTVLTQFGVKKASDLPEEKWGELLAALEKAKAGGADDTEFA